MKNLIEAWCKIYLEQKFKIEEMADSKRNIHNKIRDTRKDLLTHLICYFVWSDTTTDKQHWEKDIRNALFTMPKIKGINKYPSEKQLWDWGFETTIESIEDQLIVWLESTEIKEEKELPKNIDYVNLQRFMSQYVIWLYKELAKPENSGTIQLNNVRKVLQDLYKQYHN